MAKPHELRDLPVDEIERRLGEAKEELFNLRFQNATGQLDNYKRIGQVRKEIARIKTILRATELHEHSEAGSER